MANDESTSGARKTFRPRDSVGAIARAMALLLLACFGWWWLAWARDEAGRTADGTSPILAVLKISPQVLAPLADRPFDWNNPISETILGAEVTGTSKATGQVSLELVPDEREAALMVVLRGQSQSTTVAAAGPARIHSHAAAPFIARKRILLDAQGFRSLPAAVEAHADTTTDGIGSTLPGLRGRIVEQVASRRVEQDRPESERIAAEDVRRRVAQALDRAVDEHLAELNKSLVFPRVLADAAGNGRSTVLRFATTGDWLTVTVTLGAGEPIGAPPVEVADHGPIVLYINCLEVGEGAPMLLRVAGRAHHAMLGSTSIRKASGGPLTDSPLAGAVMEAVQRRGVWLVAFLVPGKKAVVQPRT